MADLKKPGIPALPPSLPLEMRQVLAPMKQILDNIDGYQAGNIVRTLQGYGLVTANGGSSAIPQDVIDTLPPPAPENLTVSGALANIILAWDATTYNNIGATEIWRNDHDDLATAVKVGEAGRGANVYADNLGRQATFYYWIRYRSRAGIAGPYNAQAGTEGSTSPDPSYLMDLLSQNGYDTFFYKQTDPNLVINGQPVPVGVYMRDSYIAHGTIGTLQLGREVVDDSNIANLNVNKVNAGMLSAAYINVDEIKAQIGTFTEANIGNASIGWAKLYGDMYSDNWFPTGGSSGWYLSRGGDLYAQNIHLRGNIDAVTFNGQVIGTGNIYEQAITGANYWPSLSGGQSVSFYVPVNAAVLITAYAGADPLYVDGNPIATGQQMVSSGGDQSSSYSTFGYVALTLAMGVGTHTLAANNGTGFSSLAAIVFKR